uniref:Uncharacterized protein n=1 Tax=Aureoumbra lagunensis TaxID=44058 RepID=A0A7S3NPK2_9STRA
MSDGKLSRLCRELRPLVGRPSEGIIGIDLEYAGAEALKGGITERYVVKYLTDEERKAFLAYQIQDNDGEYRLKFKNDDGQFHNIDTEKYRNRNGMGYAAYAVDRLGRLYLHEHISSVSHDAPEKYFFHSSFLAGRPGECFGMLKVSDGKLLYFDNDSGHYQPDGEQLYKTVQRVEMSFGEGAEIFEKSHSHMISMFGDGDTMMLEDYLEYARETYTKEKIPGEASFSGRESPTH